MIEIVARNGPPEALLCPAIICDACREQVVKDGNILYAVRYVGDARECGPLFASHKWPCSRQLETWLKDHYPPGDGWTILWEEASVFVRHLANNLRHAFTDDKAGTFLPNSIVPPPGWRGHRPGGRR